MADEPTAASIILEPLSLIFRTLWSLNWAVFFQRLFIVLAFPFKLILIPLSYLVSFLLILFAPAIYVAAYVYSWVAYFFAFAASLEPVYTFLGAAAGIGLTTGLVLSLSSNILTSSLGMQDKPRPLNNYRGKRLSSNSEYSDSDQESTFSTSAEGELQWYQVSPSRRRPVSGLLSQTILEEDDDSDSVVLGTGAT